MRIKLAAWLVSALVGLPSLGFAQEAVFVVRHGPTPLPGGSAQVDTPLSPAGIERAKVLAQRLKDAGITAIYANESLRTQQMAEPLAAALKLEVKKVPRAELATLVGKLKSEHAKDRVLVIGHVNSVPQILKALGDPAEVKLAREDNDELFVVLPQPSGAPKVMLLRY